MEELGWAWREPSGLSPLWAEVPKFLHYWNWRSWRRNTGLFSTALYLVLLLSSNLPDCHCLTPSIKQSLLSLWNSSFIFYQGCSTDKDFTHRKCSQSLGFLVCLYRASEWHMDRRISNNSTLLSSGPGLWDLQVLLHHHFISPFKNTVSCMIQVVLFQRFRELEGNCPKSHG